MPLPSDLQFHLLESWDDAQEMMRWLGERRPVLAVDTETTGFDWWSPTARLRLVQFGDEHQAWAVPFERWAGLVQDVFERVNDPLVFHNAKFDVHWLETFGCKPKRHLIDDTQLMLSLIEPRELTALKSAGKRWVDHQAAAGQDDLKKAFARAKWDWSSVPVELESYWVYAAMDTAITAHLHRLLRPLVDAEARRVYDLELTVMQILLQMERRGCVVDLEYCERQRVAMEQFAQETRAWSEATYGFGPTSSKQVAAQLMMDGVVLRKQTKSGAWSLDEEVLTAIDHPLARAMLDVRKAEKLARSYFGNFSSMCDADGIVHPGVKQCGARTGRMSVTNPALQTLPRGPLVRDAFIPREGHSMLGIDYEQIEARVFTHFAGDTDLAAMFGQGDFFTNMARRIYHDELIEKKDPRRQITKNAVYAKLYGAGVEKFAMTAGVAVADAAEFLSRLDGTFPAMKRFMYSVTDTAKSRAWHEGEGYVVTPMGRREPCDPGHEYKLINALIQGTCADIFKQTMVELDAAGLCEYLIMPVHDELIWDAPTVDVEELKVEASKIMRRDEWLVPLEVDGNIGSSWGALK